MPNINPKQIEGVMKRMGISQVPIDANRVIIECDDKNIVIENPSVTRVKMQGQENFQVSGEVSEESAQSFSDEDVKMVVEKADVSEDKAREALEKSEGDIASAILDLKS